MKLKTIGVLAGMGPRSTAPFIDQMVTERPRQYCARHDDDFRPTLSVLNQPTVHARMHAAVIDGLERSQA